MEERKTSSDLKNIVEPLSDDSSIGGLAESSMSVRKSILPAVGNGSSLTLVKSERDLFRGCEPVTPRQPSIGLPLPSKEMLLLSENYVNLHTYRAAKRAEIESQYINAHKRKKELVFAPTARKPKALSPKVETKTIEENIDLDDGLCEKGVPVDEKKLKYVMTAIHVQRKNSVPEIRLPPKLPWKPRKQSEYVHDGIPLGSNEFVYPPDSGMLNYRRQLRSQEIQNKRREREMKYFEKNTFATRLEADANRRNRVSTSSIPSTHPDINTSLTFHRSKQVNTPTRLRLKELLHIFFRAEMRTALLCDQVLSIVDKCNKEWEHYLFIKQTVEEFYEKFDNYLKWSEKSAQDAEQGASEEERSVRGLIAAMRAEQLQIVQLMGEIWRADEIVKIRRHYEKFIFILAPDEWKENYQERLEVARSGWIIDEETDMAQFASDNIDISDLKFPSFTTIKELVAPSLLEIISNAQEPDFLVPEIVFAMPEEALSVIDELEDEVVSTIYRNHEHMESTMDLQFRCQEIAARMIEDRQKHEKAVEEKEEEIHQLRININKMKGTVQVYTDSGYSDEKCRERITEITKLVTKAYKAVQRLQMGKVQLAPMLNFLEKRVEETGETMRRLPQTLVQSLARKQDKDRREQRREERRLIQEKERRERAQIALERALKRVVIFKGKKLVFRSEPPMSAAEKEKKVLEKEKKKKAESDIYFFLGPNTSFEDLTDQKS